MNPKSVYFPHILYCYKNDSPAVYVGGSSAGIQHTDTMDQRYCALNNNNRTEQTEFKIPCPDPLSFLPRPTQSLCPLLDNSLDLEEALQVVHLSDSHDDQHQ